MAKQPQIQFESAISELNDLIEKMEQGKGTLEESLANFEKGVQLTRVCQQAIKDAEQKIQVLVEKNGQVSLEPFKPQDD